MNDINEITNNPQISKKVIKETSKDVLENINSLNNLEEINDQDMVTLSKNMFSSYYGNMAKEILNPNKKTLTGFILSAFLYAGLCLLRQIIQASITSVINKYINGPNLNKFLNFVNYYFVSPFIEEITIMASVKFNIQFQYNIIKTLDKIFFETIIPFITKNNSIYSHSFKATLSPLRATEYNFEITSNWEKEKEIKEVLSKILATILDNLSFVSNYRAASLQEIKKIRSLTPGEKIISNFSGIIFAIAKGLSSAFFDLFLPFVETKIKEDQNVGDKKAKISMNILYTIKELKKGE